MSHSLYTPPLEDVPALVARIIEIRGGCKPIGPASLKTISQFNPAFIKTATASGWTAYLQKLITKELAFDYLVKLLHKQGGKCAITQVKLTPGTDPLTDATLDVIDYSKERDKDNLHYVAAWIKRARGASDPKKLNDLIKQARIY